MNINRNNNRRRGRGNNRGPGGGNNQGNRIDSRARGNAPQLLEKYRKLAHDASMNDDRVQTEYYLQFADHYFRVIADSRSQKDEVRRREFDREQQDDEDQDEDAEEAGHDRSSRDQDRPSRDHDRAPRDRAPRDQRDHREAREQREPRRNRSADDATVGVEEPARGVEGEVESGEEANPFIRDTRARRQRPRSRAQAGSEWAEGDSNEAGVDPAALPPSIGRGDEEAAEEKPVRARTPRPRTRKPRPADNGDAEPLEAVS